MNFDNCIHLCSSNIWQDIKYYNHPRKFSHTHSQLTPTSSPPEETTVLIFSHYRTVMLVLELQINEIIYLLINKVNEIIHSYISEIIYILININ